MPGGGGDPLPRPGRRHRLRTSDQRSYTNSMTKPVAPGPRHSLTVRVLEAADVASYRELRLEGLKTHPEAFSSSWEYEAGQPVSWWAERLQMNTVFGGWVDRSPLVGVAGLRVQDPVKLRHKGVLWGMYVRPEARGTGLAAALVRQVVERARTVVEEICLSVVSSNVAARRLYSGAGFKEYGLERRAIKVGSEYYDELLMALLLNPVDELAPRN
jgi:RimJ/RimL family protein N-acetyltransferase